MSSPENDYPNFGHAYPAATIAATPPTVSSTTWNPPIHQDPAVEEVKAPESSNGGASSPAPPPPGESDDDFFDRYPGATPKKQQTTPQQMQETVPTDVDREDNEAAERRARAISISHTVQVESEVREKEEEEEEEEVEEVQTRPESFAHVEAPLSVHDRDEEDLHHDEVVPNSAHANVSRDGAEDCDESAFFHSGETMQKQELHLGKISDPGSDVMTQAIEAQIVTQSDHAAHGPPEMLDNTKQGYEHQGAASEIEDSRREEPNVPLLECEGAPHTSGCGEGEPMTTTTMMDGEAAPRQPEGKASAVPPKVDRSFTTNFTETDRRRDEPDEPKNDDAVGGAWPSVGDEKTFGELLDQPEELKVDREQQWDVKESHATSNDWPTADSDEKLDELLDGEQQKQMKSTEHMDNSDAAKTQSPTGSQKPGESAPAPTADEEDLAAKWQAALDDDDLLADDGNELNPAKFFDEDEDGLLLDDDEPFLSQEPLDSSTRNLSTTAPQQQRQSLAIGGVAQPMPSPISQSHSRAAGTPDTGLFDVYNNSSVVNATLTSGTSRPAVKQAQSFADKSKSGYSSPYDLPMDVVKPRRQRAAPQQQQQRASTTPAPPPRTSSFGSTTQQSISSLPRPPSSSAAGAPSVINLRQPNHSTTSTSGVNGTTSQSTPKTDSGFFADLPVVSKPRVRSYTPAAPAPGTQGPVSPPEIHPSRGIAGMAPQQSLQRKPIEGSMVSAQQSQQQQANVYGGFLMQPERMPLLPDQPTVSAAAPLQRPPPSGVSHKSRYSPAPATTVNTHPVASSRYSPAPTAAGLASQSQPKRQPSNGPAIGVGAGSVVNPYAPRTSSPLAYAHDKPHPPLPSENEVGKIGNRGTMSSTSLVNGTAPAVSGTDGQVPSLEQKTRRYESGTPPTSHVPESPQFTPPIHAQPPPRPKTQSPTATMKQSRVSMSHMERPTSAAGVPMPQSYAQYQPHQQQQQKSGTPESRGPLLPHRRQFSREVSFAPPTDATSQDPLQRWKGHPIFSWNAGGTVVFTFPKHTPFWSAGPGATSIKCMPGNIHLQEAAGFLPMDERNAKFPGPLPARSKGSRKKDVLAWMKGKIEDLERAAEGAMLDFGLEPEGKKRAEEKVVLWKLMRIFVEHDGVLDVPVHGGDVEMKKRREMEEAVRAVLLPNLEQMSRVVDLHSPVSATMAASEPVDKTALIQIRQALLEGQRERAVWLAEERKLWGHAMLIASTMGPDTWKQIVQSFVRGQVKSVGGDARSLAALYQVFAGNSEDCVDELVPPSARAGFQMVSKSDGSVRGDPLVGLDQWRETLGLVVGNRTANDGVSLRALGRLLADYGRVEAAHACFLFARPFVKMSGADDPETDFVLLGANHKSDVEIVGQDLDAVILSEIYEWASSLAPEKTSSTTGTALQYIPHLQAYKLLHAQQLAAFGLKTKAQTYCEHVVQAYTSTTRPSAYYHPAFTQSVADLQAFLAQAPHDGKGSGLFSRPAMKTVSSGAASWFSKFVAGEEEQAHDGGLSISGGAASDGESGPFGRVSGEISRSASGSELYGSGVGVAPMTVGSVAPPTSSQYTTTIGFGGGGKHAPGGTYVPKAASEHSAAGGRYVPHLQQSVGLSPGEGNNFSPFEVTNSLGVPSLAPPNHQQRPVSAPRPTSSRYAPATPSSHTTATNASAAPHGLVVNPSSLGVPSRPEGLRTVSDYAAHYPAGSRRGSAQDVSSQGSGSSYMPSPSLAQEPNPYQYQAVQHSPLVPPAVPVDELVGNNSSGAGSSPNYLEMAERQGSGEDRDEEGGSLKGYQPLTANEAIASYEPPSYQPYDPSPVSDEANDDEENADAKPAKKKMFGDEDDDADDLVRRAAALKQKADADRAADEAFRRAAEADAARDKKTNDGGRQTLDRKSTGWFGGWFKKDPSAELGKPIRAKLGEENSFYYDEKLKKWVNRKAGPEEAAAQVSATPPPPRGPASRVASSGSSGPPPRVASAGGVRPPTSGSVAALPPSGPPSRAGTPASSGGGAVNGEATAAVVASGPPSRPPTSMSTASSLDDLLGGPPGTGRKPGGTVKGKKKTGRYVDVMAKG
ncbi:hypothetical protein M433DRAFT_82059 [Acidomyces richmondensis BFW]|nr:MAG: hypothetical protein FE78DRAFT_172692 [Acidomyces sp. 'richmondensis']KYG49454.1 hypothetical protein M433DRAFT_82059 [Acidomyces richmondensis BFW]